MRPLRRAFWPCFSFAIVVASSPAARAGTGANAALAAPGDAARAEGLFREGIALWQAQLWAGALERFEASIALHPTHAAYVNSSLCLEKLGRNADALAAVEKAIEHANGDEAALARKRAELLRLVGQLTVRGGVAGGVVLIDGKERGRLPLDGPLRVDAGTHLVRVGGFSRRVDVVVDHPEVVDVPGEGVGAASASSPSSSAPSASPPSGTARWITSGSLVAAGVGGFVVAGLFAGSSNRSLAQARSDGDRCGRCAEAPYADARDARTWSRIALAAGVGFTVAGGAVFAWWPGKTSIAVSGSSVALRGEF